MDRTAKSLEELIQELPSDLRAEVRDFVESLLAKRERHTGLKLRQDWAGALRDYREQYMSLELEQQTLEWRSAEAIPA
jgi:hypothetical protein